MTLLANKRQSRKVKQAESWVYDLKLIILCCSYQAFVCKLASWSHVASLQPVADWLASNYVRLSAAVVFLL